MHSLDTVGAAQVPIQFHSGEGPILWSTEGRMYWDFYGGHAVTLIGNSHPDWVAALTKQAQLLGFCTTIAAIPIREEAASKLCQFTGMDVAWFVNSGSEANEGALKMARKYTGKNKVIAMERGFHGRTMGSLGATWKYREQHKPVHGDTEFIAFGDLQALALALDEDVAAVIVEPIQGIAGIIEPPAGYLQKLSALCKEKNVLLICDEIQSGVGRGGEALLSVAMGAEPDIVTLGKGLGGGFPVSAVLMSQEIANTIKAGEHGSTFGGSPLACASILATLRIIEDEELLDNAKVLESMIRKHLQIPGVVEIRGCGAWLGIELDRLAKPVAMELLEHGIFTGTCGDPYTIRLAPPAKMPECGVLQLKRWLTEILQQPCTYESGVA